MCTDDGVSGRFSYCSLLPESTPLFPLSQSDAVLGAAHVGSICGAGLYDLCPVRGAEKGMYPLDLRVRDAGGEVVVGSAES